MKIFFSFFSSPTFPQMTKIFTTIPQFGQFHVFFHVVPVDFLCTPTIYLFIILLYRGTRTHRIDTQFSADISKE